MCLDFLMPKAPQIVIPPAPLPPPPPTPAAEVTPPVLGGSSRSSLAGRRIGKRRLQIPLAPGGTSGGVQTPS